LDVRLILSPALPRNIGKVAEIRPSGVRYPRHAGVMTTTSQTRGLDRAGSRIDHLNIAVPELAAAVAFYEPTLASIGITKMLQIPEVSENDQPAMTGFGLAEVKPYFWLIDRGSVGTNMHVAFTVDTRDQVDVFFRTALGAGATPLQAPAVHPEYHPDYYGGFVRDPYGINLEAVCHRPETS
jgi:catechol 2,3-dioxygenase-like lactoylglutathione lyase family enzyme